MKASHFPRISQYHNPLSRILKTIVVPTRNSPVAHNSAGCITTRSRKHPTPPPESAAIFPDSRGISEFIRRAGIIRLISGWLVESFGQRERASAIVEFNIYDPRLPPGSRSRGARARRRRLECSGAAESRPTSAARNSGCYNFQDCRDNRIKTLPPRK